MIAPPKSLHRKDSGATAAGGMARGKEGQRPSQMAAFMEELRREQVTARTTKPAARPPCRFVLPLRAL